MLPTLQNLVLYSNTKKGKKREEDTNPKVVIEGRKKEEETNPKVVIKHLNRTQLYKGQVTKRPNPSCSPFKYLITTFSIFFFFIAPW